MTSWASMYLVHIVCYSVAQLTEQYMLVNLLSGHHSHTRMTNAFDILTYGESSSTQITNGT